MGADDKPFNRKVPLRRAFGAAGAIATRPLFLVFFLILFAVIFSLSGSTSSRQISQLEQNKAYQTVSTPYPYEEKGAFYPYLVQGFDNTGRPGGPASGHNVSCSSLGVQSEIGVQKPWDLTDDLTQVANELDDHPMVYYTQKVFGKEPGRFQLRQVVENSWDRLAGSCVLLQDRNVFLCISRIIFHDDARRDHIQISFLRGQIWSRSWVHMENYEFVWHGRKIIFPRIFDTGTEFATGGDVFGPEDPRIIVERDVPDAEPVIIFNMISEKAQWKRAMWIFRPFTESAHILTIEGRERNKKEKNWAPFFMHDPEVHSGVGERQPSRFIHFVYNFSPLEILKCSLFDGMCQQVFMQHLPEDLRSIHDNQWSEIRGGTQWMPIPLPATLNSAKSSSKIQAWVSFPRTHTEQTSFCYAAVYRPEMTVMVSNGTDFYFAYVSGPLDFGVDIVIPEDAYNEPCGASRIFIINSIADWDLNAKTMYSDKTDVMTLTFTIMDATIQAVRVNGILELIYSLPAMKRLIRDPTSVFGKRKAVKDYHDDPFTRHSAVSHDVRSCAEEGVRTYIDDHVQPEDRPALLKKYQQRVKDAARRVIEYPDENHHPAMEEKGH